MKVQAISDKVDDIDIKALGINPKNRDGWNLTVGEQYLVYAIHYSPNSIAYGNSMQYQIMDDFERLLVVPACLFTVVDSKVSPSWFCTYWNKYNFKLEPKEFVADPHLAEKILDRDPEALSIFSQIHARLILE